MAAGLPLMKKILTPIAKNVLSPIELSAAMLPAYAAIQKKFHGSDRFPSDLASRPSESASHTTTLIISNEEREDIMKIVKSLEEPGLLVKGIKETIKNETKEQKGIFLSMLLRTIAASSLGSALTGKGVKAGEIVIRLGEDFFLLSHTLSNFEIQKYYQNEPKFNGVYSRNNSSKIKDGACVINLDKYKSIETHWIAFYVNGNSNAIYFDRFGVEYIPKEI